MKKNILSVIAILFLTLIITSSTYAATAINSNFTILNDISIINKIELHGNVELYISDGGTDQVKIYNQYYAESALVQNKKGVLCISSYSTEKLVVWITANDLRSVSAYDNAEVKSFGNISKIEFDMDLHDNASAKLDLDAYIANVTLTDHAKADLNGNATEFNLKHNIASSINKYNFVANHITDSRIFSAAEMRDAELAEIF